MILINAEFYIKPDKKQQFLKCADRHRNLHPGVCVDERAGDGE
ncbi:hypothetical protein [Trichococcus patagoniensis]|nr:hypothetical protein [Trichococcus patagoniensis]